MSIDKDPSQNNETISWGRTTPSSPIDRLTSAITERQKFIEAVYYQDSSISMPFKPLTEPMKRLIIDPIDELITKDLPHKPKKTTGRLKLLPSLDQWLQEKAPDLTFKDFKTLISKEKELDEKSRKTFLELFIIRTINKYFYSTSLKEYEEPMEEYIEVSSKYAVAPPFNKIDETQIVNKPILIENFTLEQQHKFNEIKDRLKQVRRLTSQMKKFGVDRVIKHHEIIRSIKAAIFPKDIDIIINSAISEYPRISILLKNSPLETANASSLDELSKELFFAVRDKRLELQIVAASQDKVRSTFTQEDLSINLNDQFKTAFEYLVSLIPENKRHFLDQSPFYILKLAMTLRKVLPVANAEVLAQIWWQLRLGNQRAKDIIDNIEREWPGFVKKQRLEKYAKHLDDNFLESEASGFEFQNTVSINNETSPNQIVFQVVKNLIRNHIPKDQKHIRVTLLNRDKSILKLTIDYREGMLDSEIENNIAIALGRNRIWKPIKLTEEERVQLSYLGHNAEKRKKNKNYKTVYQGFGKNQETGEEYEGDYLIQIGTVYDDSRDPRSLFAVDSHKTAVQLKFKDAGEVIVTTRYNHQYFDGKPAKIHTASLISAVNSTETKNSSLQILPVKRVDEVVELDNSQVSYLKDRLEPSKELEFPLIEARSDYDDDNLYSSISLDDSDENAYLSSTDLRCLTLARANGIQYFQQLVAGDKASGSFFVRNPNADNIQPVVVAPIVLSRKNRIQWVKNYRAADKRAKKSIGDVALFASIAGTREAPLTYAGSFLNKALTNMLTQSQGMISPLMEYANFTTAFSDAYRPEKIDLTDPVPSMGIIGMSIDKKGTSHYTVRLLPSQAQRQLKQAVEELFSPDLTEKQKSTVLKEFTKIIKAWDQLVGGAGNQNQITLQEYINQRNTIVNSLVKKGLITLKNLSSQEKTIQMYLNNTLKKAAENIFDPIKIIRARKEIETILEY